MKILILVLIYILILNIKKFIASRAIPIYIKELRPKLFIEITLYEIIINRCKSLNAKDLKRF